MIRIMILPVRARAFVFWLAFLFAANAVPAAAQTTFIVNSTAHPGNGVCDQQECTLQEAIGAANATADVDSIFFQINGGGSIETIMPFVGALRDITQPVVIDGTTQNCGTGPCIVIDGSNTDQGFPVEGLVVMASNSTIRGLVIHQFNSSGILLNGQGNRIEGNYIGTDPTGMQASLNGSGVLITAGTGNVIGGTTPEARNVIAGSFFSGIVLQGSGTTGNRIEGNYIGLNAAGDSLGNGRHGVHILDGASNNIIGGVIQSARNVLSGNRSSGIAIQDSSTTGNRVEGNYIGLDASGTATLGNGVGVSIDFGASGNIIGGAMAGAGNVIVGSSTSGVVIGGIGSTGNLVQGNFIGTNAGGDDNLGNSIAGVFISNNASDNTIGGIMEGAGNTIAYNGGDGVRLFNNDTQGNRIRLNAIFENDGLGINLAAFSDDATGITPNDLGDGDDGPNRLQNTPVITAAELDGAGYLYVTYRVDSDPAIVSYPLSVDFFKADGDGEEGQIFLVSDIYFTPNYPDGVSDIQNVDSLTVGDRLVATATDADGNTSEFSEAIEVTRKVITVNSTADVENGDDGFCTLREAIIAANINEPSGIEVGECAAGDDEASDRIEFAIPSSTDQGCDEEGVCIISPNDGLPPLVESMTIDGYTQPGASPNTMEVGSNAEIKIILNGINAGPNPGYNLATEDTLMGQTIINFAESGVWIRGDRNLVQGNRIGVSYDNNVTVVESNGKDGILIEERSRFNMIGGTLPGARNVISANGESGIVIQDNGSTGNRIEGNYIGTDVHGVLNFGNVRSGVVIRLGAGSNIIGGSAQGARNVIAGNGNDGVRLSEAGTINNLVEGNYIGLNAAGDSLGNALSGVFITDESSDNITAANTIAFNHQNGVTLDATAGTGNIITRNAIFENDLLGIDLGNDGSSGEDDGDPDSGPNNLQNPPRFSQAEIDDAGNLIVTYSVNSRPDNAAYDLTVEFFKADAGGEGRAWIIDSIYLESDYRSGTSIPANLGNALALGEVDYLVATATDANGNTSEFSALFALPPRMIVVNSTADNNPSISGDNECTLREAITNANMVGDATGEDCGPGTADADSITFNIPGSDPGCGGDGVCTILLEGALPAITRPVVIDGARQIVLDGSEAGDGVDGLTLLGQGSNTSVVRGLVIRGFRKNGIVIESGSSFNRIGGNDPAARNVIVDNGQSGIRIENANGNFVWGNYIGLDAAGDSLGNGVHGVYIHNGANDNVIGGDRDGQGNVISGNKMDGVHIKDASATGNRIEGNYIGTDTTGMEARANGVHGVLVKRATNTVIGGTSSTTPGDGCAGACNLISGNLIRGINIEDRGTDGTIIQGNYIGIDASGLGALGLGGGVLIIEASRTTIGDTTSAGRNVVIGVGITGGTYTVVQGNYIGTDHTGSKFLADGNVQLSERASNNTIGGTVGTTPGGNCTGACNVIEGIIQIKDEGTNDNTVEGNYIGVTANGNASLNSGNNGIEILSGAANNTIGGATPAARNVISGLGLAGVVIQGEGTTDNKIQGNYIGLQANGTDALPNGVGVLIQGGAGGNTIGGTTLGEGNIIAFNNFDGVILATDAGTGNAIRGNRIYGNIGIGIDLNDDDATPNDSGDDDTGPNNLQNFPVITDAVIDGSGNLIVTYSVDSTPNNNAVYPLTVEFFETDVDLEEGEFVLGSDNYTNTGDRQVSLGNATALDIDAGDRLVATATDDAGNTSEFSEPLEVTLPPENLRPVARFTATPSPAPLTVNFDASASSDPDGSIETYAWDFGDGSTSSGASPMESHQYPRAGHFTLMLTVTDDDDATGDTTATISVSFTYSIVEDFGDDPTKTSSYRLVALPGNDVVSLASTLAGQSSDEWIAYHDNGEEVDHPAYLVKNDGTPLFDFKPGRGFWLLSKKRWTPSGTASPVQLTDGVYAIEVNANGWTIISNPFDTPVSWDSVLAVNEIDTNPSLYRYDGMSTDNFASARTGEAFYFNNPTAATTLKIPYPGLATIPETTPLPAPTRVLTLAAYHDDQRVAAVRAGTARQAKPGRDAYDTVGPPGVFEAVSLRLVNEHFTTPRSALAAEFRPDGSDGEVFEVMLRAQEDTPITLRAEGLEAFAASEVYLVDRETSKRYDLHAQPTLALAVSPRQSRYSLVVGSAAFVEETTEAMVPETLALMANYPNPFNPSTIIEYTVPAQEADAVVRLEVFNVLGQQVRVLVDAPHRPGFYRITWDGTDAAGTQVASGVYLYRLHVRGRSLVRSMLLVK